MMHCTHSDIVLILTSLFLGT